MAAAVRSHLSLSVIMFDRGTTVVAVCCLLLLIGNLATADQNIPYEDPAAAAPYYPAGAFD